MSNIASYYLRKKKKNRTKGVEMPFMMSVTLQVATKLFDQQAAEPPILFCNLMRIFKRTIGIFLKELYYMDSLLKF